MSSWKRPSGTGIRPFALPRTKPKRRLKHPVLYALHTLARSFRAIKEGGRVVTVATNAESSEDPRVKEAFFIVEPNREQLVQLAKLIDAGAVRPILGEVLPLEKGAQAYFPQQKPSRGKTVLRVLSP